MKKEESINSLSSGHSSNDFKKTGSGLGTKAKEAKYSQTMKPINKSKQKPSYNTSSLLSAKANKSMSQSSSQSSKILNKTSPATAPDECGQIANEMIILVYEKIEKIKLQKREHLEIKRKLDFGLSKCKDEVNHMVEVNKKLEKDIIKVQEESGEINKDCEKIEKDTTVIIEKMQKAIMEDEEMKKSFQANIEEYIKKADIAREELLKSQETQIVVDKENDEKKIEYLQRISIVEREIEELKEAIKQSKIKENQRIKKFTATTRSLDVAAKASLNEASSNQ